jgi:hypothetical protein
MLLCVQLTLSAFRIDNYCSPAVGFSVARSTPLVKSGQVTFDIVLIDTHKMWKSDKSCFTASQNGVYFFHYNVGTDKSSFYYASLNVNRASIVTLVDEHVKLFTATGVDLLNACAMTSLKVGDEITLTTGAVRYWSYKDNSQVSLSGFLYSPVSRQQVKQTY